MDRDTGELEAEYASIKAQYDERLQKLRSNLIRRCRNGDRYSKDYPYFQIVLKLNNSSRDQAGKKRRRSPQDDENYDTISIYKNKGRNNDISLSWRRVDWERTEDIPSVVEQLRILKSLDNPSDINASLYRVLQRPSAMQREKILSFQSAPSAKGMPSIRPFCRYLTKDSCMASSLNPFLPIPDDEDGELSSLYGKHICTKLHFVPNIRPGQTELESGNCSYLNTCRNPRTCKYIHYDLDPVPITPLLRLAQSLELTHQIPRPLSGSGSGSMSVRPQQWINCDVRSFDLSILGKFGVIMTDPPWEIHQELPYGTMKDHEMMKLGIKCLQDEGIIFMWVTGRALELGRECLQEWGYDCRVDELIWVKTNQLQQLIRTGRTGHWLNHTKEHCLVGIKGNPKLNRYVDCDVIVSEVRETSRKPDEVYRLLERLSPGSRKIEIFARRHNFWDGWLSLGNQLENVNIVEPDLREKFIQRYRVVPELGKPLLLPRDAGQMDREPGNGNAAALGGGDGGGRIGGGIKKGRIIKGRIRKG